MSLAARTLLAHGGRRQFHASACAMLRRRGGFRQEEKSEFEELLDSPPSFYNDVPSEYQQVLMREAVLVRSYLEKVKHELPRLKETLRPEPFKPTPDAHFLRFRRIRILGDPLHPLHSKAVLTLSVPHLLAQTKLDAKQGTFLKKLLGSRYDPTTETIKMSCERFPHYAQNKKWLADTLNALVDNARTAQDVFDDVPLDLRHAAKKIKRIQKAEKLQFPESWLQRAMELRKQAETSAKAAVPATPSSNSEVEETLKRLSAHKGVQGIVIVNSEGIPIRTTLDNSLTVQYSALITQLAAKAKSVVRDLDPQNDLQFLRIRSKKHEIMVAPDKEYLLIVIQNPNEHKRRRYISINPEKILDAPGIVGDFYMDILSWSADGSLAVGLQHQVVPSWDYALSAVAFSALPARPDLLAGFDDGSLVQVDVGQKKVVATTSFHGGQRVSAVTTYGSDLIVSGDSGGCIALWDVRQFGPSKRPAHCLPEHTHGGDIICTAKSSFDGLYLATGGNNNTFAVWDVRNLGAQPVFSKSGIDGHQSAVRAIAWSPWQRNLLVTAGGSNDGFIKMWDAYSALKLGQRSTGSQITNVIVAPHHRELITSHGFASLSVGARQARGAAVPSPALSAAPAQPSRRPTRDANHLCIWSYPSLETVWKTCPAAHDDRVLFMALSPDGETVATAAADENVKIWRVFGESDRSLLTTAAAAKKEDC
ncbi:WD repeat-containing protein slp1 [Sorochytrium milnesiophthora]